VHIFLYFTAILCILDNQKPLDEFYDNLSKETMLHPIIQINNKPTGNQMNITEPRRIWNFLLVQNFKKGRTTKFLQLLGI